jgi:acylphosphatase
MNQKENTRVRLRISGLVQGVNFRSSACREAQRLCLVGFVRNEPDGSLVIEVEGGSLVVNSFCEWAKHGPSRARVECVTIESLPVVADGCFRIRL